MRASAYPYFDVTFCALAHRGGAEYGANRGIENTLLAFQNAVALGYDYLETDVHVTADGHLVAFHDEVLDRVTDRSGAIGSLSFDEVRSARIGGREQIPTMHELLTALPHARFNIDIKSRGAIAPLAALLAELDAEKRVCVGSFSDARLQRFRDLTKGRVATSAGPSAVAWSASVRPLARWFNTPAVAFQVPVSHQVAGVRLPIVTAAFVRMAHARDMRVHVWTINDADHMRQLVELGVDGIVTDAIDVLKSVLEEARLWTQR